LHPDQDSILNMTLKNDQLFKSTNFKLKQNLENLTQLNFENILSEDITELFQYHYNKLTSFSNKFLNRLNYYQNTAIAIRNLELPNKEIKLKRLIDEIDKKMKIINEKANIINKRFLFVKNSIVKLVNTDKDILIGKINCKNFFKNKVNIINNLKKQFKQINIYMQNLNETKVNLYNKKLSIMNINFIDDERIKRASELRNSIVKVYKQFKQEF